ncbi:MAG TPA: DNA-processing protein DprA [Gemmatimonadales bacterium]|nr:DNA-processing protein DprA [Gemmatimonadales bacterium]
MGDLDDERAMYLAIAMTPGIGPHRLATLLQACTTSLGAHSAPFSFLSALPGFSRAAATAVREARVEEGHRLLRQSEEMGARVMTLLDPAYPALLHTIGEPPPVIFLLGNCGLLDCLAVAIVGSRDHSPYGAEVCRTLATAAARRGIVVISGMARGLDAVGHVAALDAGGGTIGVLGNGLGVVYPAANRALYDRVAAQGLLLTEFPPGERPSVYTFPRRNRLISALARATVVVEAASGSGALITADAALEQGRDVMAVPGNITSHTSVGTNRLIRDGAVPVLEAADLLGLYPEADKGDNAGVAVGADKADEATNRLTVEPAEAHLSLNPIEQRILGVMGTGPAPVDELAARAELPVPEALSALFTLELAGRVEQWAGGLFARASPVRH